MTKIIHNKEYCLFIDLDDTLYNEVDFVISGYNHIYKWVLKNLNLDIQYRPSKKDVINNIENHIQTFIKKNNLAEKYSDTFIKLIREHKPNINLSYSNLKKLKVISNTFKNLVLITNGRSISQRNKLQSLNIQKFFMEILISEEFGFKKPDKIFYEKIIEKYKNYNLIFIGDNIDIDLITPIDKGLKTILIKNLNNRIHKLNNNHPNIREIDLIYDKFSLIEEEKIVNLFS